MTRHSPSTQHLALLLKVSALLSSTRSLDAVLNDMLAEVLQTLGGERGFVVVRKDGEWHPAAVHYESEKHRLEATRFSRTIVQATVDSGQPVVALDALQDERFCAPSVTLMGIRAVMCAPLRWAGQTMGAVYVDHSIRAGAFTQADLELLVAITGQASRALETADLHLQLRRAGGPAGQGSWESWAGRQTVDYLLGSLGDEEAASRAEAPAVAPAPAVGTRVYLFGSPRVLRDGREVDAWRSRKDRDLFAYLAAHRGQVQSEDKLMDLFWSSGGKKGLHSLHNSVTQIRKTLEDPRRELLQRKLDGYCVAADCWVDSEEFSRAFLAGRKLAGEGLWEEAIPLLHEADGLAAQEFLAGQYADWTQAPRARLGEQAMECRSLLADYFRQRGKHVVAVELWKRVLSYDNCHEAAYRGLLESYRALGRQADAVRVYQACVKAFEEELELPPPEDLAALAEF